MAAEFSQQSAHLLLLFHSRWRVFRLRLSVCSGKTFLSGSPAVLTLPVAPFNCVQRGRMRLAAAVEAVTVRKIHLSGSLRSPSNPVVEQSGFVTFFNHDKRGKKAFLLCGLVCC